MDDGVHGRSCGYWRGPADLFGFVPPALGRVFGVWGASVPSASAADLFGGFVPRVGAGFRGFGRFGSVGVGSASAAATGVVLRTFLASFPAPPIETLASKRHPHPELLPTETKHPKPPAQTPKTRPTPTETKRPNHGKQEPKTGRQKALVPTSCRCQTICS